MKTPQRSLRARSPARGQRTFEKDSAESNRHAHTGAAQPTRYTHTERTPEMKERKRRQKNKPREEEAKKQGEKEGTAHINTSLDGTCRRGAPNGEFNGLYPRVASHRRNPQDRHQEVPSAVPSLGGAPSLAGYPLQ